MNLVRMGLRFLNSAGSSLLSIRQLRHTAVTSARINAFDLQSFSPNSLWKFWKYCLRQINIFIRQKKKVYFNFIQNNIVFGIRWLKDLKELLLIGLAGHWCTLCSFAIAKNPLEILENRNMFSFGQNKIFISFETNFFFDVFVAVGDALQKVVYFKIWCFEYFGNCAVTLFDWIKF